MTIKPEDDFQGYMEALERSAEEARLMEAMLERHRVWRETSWGGFAVRQLEGLAEFLKPFIIAVVDILKNDGSNGNIFVTAVVRLMAILFFISLLFVGGWIIQSVLGTEYEIIEEVIVVEGEEDDEGASDETKKKEQ